MATSLVSTCSYGNLHRWRGSGAFVHQIASAATTASGAAAVRDLPLEFFYRVEDLPAAPLKAAHKLTPEELTPTLVTKANEILWNQYPPLGSEIPITVDGKAYIGRIERHFHEFGGPKQPWGYHNGITLYAAE